MMKSDDSVPIQTCVTFLFGFTQAVIFDRFMVLVMPYTSKLHPYY